MTGNETKDVTGSVLAQLRNAAKSSRAPFQQLLQLYAIERFLYRISRSRHAQGVILKGALLLMTIGIPIARATVDINMLRRGRADEASLVKLVKECATVDVEADGVVFITESVVTEEIAKDSEFKETRVLMHARMDNVRLKIQVGFGVGDVMVPGPRMIEYPVILGSDTIPLLAYPIESSVAEKLQAMVARGNANSWMKDFYDVWICSNHLDFNADALLRAIDATFRNRETAVPADDVEALTTAFVEAHRVQWNAFVRKIGENELIDEFGRIVDDVKVFAMPALRALASGERLAQQWKAGRGWVAV
jgi:predicted nucleotidyltransferase component of viral defense system